MLNNAVNSLRLAVNPVVVSAPVAAAPAAVNPAFPGMSAMAGAPLVQLRQMGDDASFMASLTVGGRLNGTVRPEDAACAVRVAMAQSIRLYDIPEAIAERIEQQANALETPASADVYDLIDGIRAREYAHILKPLGAPTRSVNASERTKFLSKVQNTLWPGLRRFHAGLHAWYEAFKAERADVSNLVAAFSGGILPVTTDTGVLRSAAADLTTMTNKLFAGLTAVPVARAMAADAVTILQQLNEDKYVRAAGFATRDEMLRTLGVSVTEQFARNERSLAQYVVNALDIPNISDPSLPLFAQQLYLLGASLDWDSLGTSRVSEPQAPKVAARRETPKFSPFPNGSDSR